MIYRIGIILVFVSLAGCGKSANTPASVHNAWVEAIRRNDRDMLFALAADGEYRTAFVDDNLNALQDRLRSEKDGSLQSVEIQDITSDGGSANGISRWRFVARTACYRTVLALAHGAWKVTSWGVMYQCPTDAKEQ